ncbi:MAG: histidine--tRNA ligase [Chloroflexi bacterium RBG_16_68_14]|nr:MAG: histidine--tRNA ligase [Chloroflexi bacterium RBG_16_68_14]
MGRQEEEGKSRFQAPRGTSDVLPEDEPYWRFVRGTAERVSGLFGYRYIETPMFEDAGVWLRTSGEGTEVVEKEMYLFEDRGGDRLALRPETTASVCRAYVEHGMASRPQPVRLYYFAQKFRYDRPQAGRYRQHTEFGVEAIGDGEAAVDAEVIDLLATFYQALGLAGLSLHLNSIGDRACRPAYIDHLRAYYRDHLSQTCADCRLRYEKNPLRLLDCKQTQCQPVIAGAPAITERLCADCDAHFRALRSSLEALEIEYELDPHLVRGLDYYTRTVFEFLPPEEGAQSTVGGGGRYDGLIELLGGRPTPGIGFGNGIERTILNLKRQKALVPEVEAPRVYVAHASSEARVAALRLARRLRDGGVAAVLGGGRSLKAQLRHADALGARYVAILGEQELAKGEVTLRDMRDGQQHSVAEGEVTAAVAAE